MFSFFTNTPKKREKQKKRRTVTLPKPFSSQARQERRKAKAAEWTEARWLVQNSWEMMRNLRKQKNPFKKSEAVFESGSPEKDPLGAVARSEKGS